ncbi:MAG: AMP-binding protein [Fuerstiella sp.]
MAEIFKGTTPSQCVSDFADYPLGVPRKLLYPDMPAWGLLDRAARLMPGRLACQYHDVEWTWEELNLDAVRTAAALRRQGVQPGDRVGVLLPNIPEYLIVLNGIWRAGAIAVALSPLAVPEEVDRMLEATDCRVVISLDMLAGSICGPHRPDRTLFISLRPSLPLFEQLGYLLLRKKRTGHWWMSATEHVGWFWDEVTSSGDIAETAATPSVGSGFSLPGHGHDQADWAATPAYILPTGGTTGEPKAVTLSHRNMVANAWQQYYWAGASVGKETLLAVLPFFHSYGLSTNVMGGAAMVATLIMDHRFSPRKVISLVERHRPTVFHAVPAMLVAMNEQLRKRPADMSSLKWVISGGAPLPEAVGREFAEHCGAVVVEGYGLSEASPVTHVGPLDGAGPYGTIGLPLPDTDCRIVDPETGTQDVERGEIGELLVRGPQVMLGYWHQVRASANAAVSPKQPSEAAMHDTGSHAEVVTPAVSGSPVSEVDPESPAAVEELREGVSPDGWLPTGDLARLTPDGYFQIMERKKDLIITSGFNVYPQEVEHVLKTHPAVKDAAVVGLPDEQKGEVVKAFVVLHSGTAWDESSLADHCHKHLSAHKRPRVFEHCETDLPRSFLGKVIRRKLRE